MTLRAHHPVPPKVWLTSSQAARELGLHANQLRRIPPEELPYMVINGRGDRRFHHRDIDMYVHRHMIRTTPEKVIGVHLVNGRTGPLKTRP